MAKRLQAIDLKVFSYDNSKPEPFDGQGAAPGRDIVGKAGWGKLRVKAEFSTDFSTVQFRKKFDRVKKLDYTLCFVRGILPLW